MARPPLGTAVEIQRLDGSIRRFDPNDPHARNIPTSVSWRSSRGTGFADGSFTLARRVDQELPDIGLLDTVRVVTADGSIAYEGQVSAMPRTLDAGHSVTISTSGLMSRAQGRKFSEVYVDRDMSGWGDPAIARQVATALAGYIPGKITASSSASGLSFQVPTDALADKTLAELVWTGPLGVQASRVMYRGQRQGTWTTFAAAAMVGADDAAISAGLTGGAITLDNTIRSLALGGNSRYLLTQALTTGAIPTPAAGTLESFDILAVYGSSGIPTVPVTGDADGVLASDVLRDTARRFVPILDVSGVQDTTYPFGHMRFDNVTAYDAWAFVNAATGWDIAVWENARLCFTPIRTLDDYDWELRLSDFGTRSRFDGDTDQNLANGVAVSYTDVLSGETLTLDPSNTPSLADPNPANPFTVAGIAEWVDYSVAFPCTAADATQIGRIYLGEYNRVKLAGEFTVTGHVRNRAGEWRPFHEMRASERVIVSDHPSDGVRLIEDVSCDGDAKTATVTTDVPSQRLDALIARNMIARQAAGLS